MKIKYTLVPLAIATLPGHSNEAPLKSDIYGFIKASYLSVQGASADYKPFFAVKDATGNEDYDDKRHTQLSVKQSRYGMEFQHKRVSGKIEFDFDGEAGNTPGATASNTGDIRTRILEIQYKPTESDRVSIGKRWDTFSALNPHTYAVTMVQLFQGNTGFLTEAAEYAKDLGNLDIYFQLQTLGDEAAYKVSTPIATVRLDYLAGDTHKFGIALKSGEVNTEDAEATNVNVSVSGAKGYYSGTLAGVKIIGELYRGTNLGAATVGASLGNISPTTVASANSPANTGEDINDSGYYLSLKKHFGKYGVFAGYGQSEISNPEDSLADQAKASNAAARLGLDYKAEENLVLFAELTSIKTGYYQQANEDIDHQYANMLDIGMLYKF